MRLRCLAAMAALTVALTVAACAGFVPYDLRPLPSAPPPPDLSQRSRLVFVVVGDAGRGNDEQRAVGRLMAAVCAIRACDFALAPGDLIYDRGVRYPGDRQAPDGQFAAKFEEPFRGLVFPFWSVPGNHDWATAGSVQAEIEYTSHSPRWRMPFNHFAIGGLPAWVRIYGLDTSVLDEARTRPGLNGQSDEQVAAARTHLCADPPVTWRLLFGHHPLYSSGQHGRNTASVANLRQRLAGLIEACGVQAYFSGHDHLQEMLAVSAPPDRPGLSYAQVIQGAGSEARTNDRPRPEPGVRTWGVVREHGFAVVQIDREQMTIEFYGTSSSLPRPAADPVAVQTFSLRPEGVGTLRQQ